MTMSTNLFVVLAVTVLLAREVRAQSERPLHFLSKQCNEDAIELRLDPGPFQDFVGSEFSLVLEEGKARVVIVVQNCSQYWIDGDDIGPTQDIHVWVSIRGPEDLRTVIGAERTLPTRTWFYVFAGSSNPRVREAKKAAGTTVAPIEGVFLDPPGPDRGGQVFLNEDLNYSWEVESPSKPPAYLLGLNHDIYTRDSDGNIVLNQVQALMHVSAGQSTGTLKVVGETNTLPLIGAGNYIVLVQTFFPMWSRATLGLVPSH
jgi:hypothetical protein